MRDGRCDWEKQFDQCEDSNLNLHYESVIGGFEPASYRERLMTINLSVIISFPFLCWRNINVKQVKKSSVRE